MIAAQKKIRPGRCSPQSLILHDRGMVEQTLFLFFMPCPLISAKPYTIAEPFDLAMPVERSSARPVPLVLSALGLRTKEHDFRQRTIAAILAAEKNSFAEVFHRP